MTGLLAVLSPEALTAALLVVAGEVGHDIHRHSRHRARHRLHRPAPYTDLIRPLMPRSHR